MAFVSEEGRAKIEKVIKTAVQSFDGLEVVETKFFREYGSDTVEVFIWKKGGVDLNACEQVHGAVDAALDGVDELFAGPYMLKISSMGLDRLIKTDDDFRRALDTEIEYTKEGAKRAHGVLVAYDAETVTINDGNRDVNIERKYLTKVQPYIRF